jgi:hypothetical protein
MSLFLASRNQQWQCSGNDPSVCQEKSASRRSARHNLHGVGRGMQQQYKQLIEFVFDVEFAGHVRFRVC